MTIGSTTAKSITNKLQLENQKRFEENCKWLGGECKSMIAHWVSLRTFLPKDLLKFGDAKITVSTDAANGRFVSNRKERFKVTRGLGSVTDS